MLQRSADFELAAASADAGIALQRLPPSPTHLVGERAAARGGMAAGAPGAQLLLEFCEAAAIAASSIVAGAWHHGLFLGGSGSPRAFLAVGLLGAVIYAGAMHMIDSVHRTRAPLGRQTLRDMGLVWIGTILFITFVIFSFKTGDNVSRGAMVTFMFVGFASALAVRASLPRVIAAHYRPAQLAGHRPLVIGARHNGATGALLAQLRMAGFADPDVVELDTEVSDPEWRTELPVSLARIFTRARLSGHGDICVAAGGFPPSRLREITDALRAVPRAVRVVPHPSVESLLHLPIRNVGKLLSVELQKAPLNAAQLFAKRALDLVLATLLLFFVVPASLVIAAAIKLDSGGPVLFVQQRLGYRGRSFAILKFRTMTVLEDGDVVRQAQRNDTRFTRVGRWLRATSLDELPQLLNVIRGQMSLVGPRPHAVAHDEFYGRLIGSYELRQHVRPGITGWAQVHGLRGETASLEPMRRRIEYDLWYAKNASLWLDLKILLLTILEVARGCNAC